jgi:conjugative transfer signal peptidase TraF
MPASHDRPVARRGGAFRRNVAARVGRRRLAVAILAAVAATPPLLTLVFKPPLVLVWNASASAPVGLYRVNAHAPVRKGDMAIAWAPHSVRRLAAARLYVLATVPLVKRIAAAGGDRVCASGKLITLNGRHAAVRRRKDHAGRPMPWWYGCRTLGADEYFLLMDRPDSFDGRYFGPTGKRDIVGRAVLLWAR